MAVEAVNTDLASGPLDGLPQPKPIIDLSGSAPWEVRRAYRMPGPVEGQPDVWLPLPSEFSSVCRSPLANDTLHRIFWTNPPGSPDAGAWWNTYERLAAGGTGGNAHWNMGFLPPDISAGAAPVISSVTGGTPDIPLVERSYVYTFIDTYGTESSPSAPSNVMAGTSDGVWHITNLPATAPPMPAGKVYPPPTRTRLYRTLTAATQGAQFYFVVDLPFGTTAYDDVLPDTTVVNNNTLLSVSFAPPVDGLDGLLSMAGGMMVGFTRNTVHFCEPDRPNAWPAGYDQSLMYQIVALGVWQQQLIVLTHGFPSTGVGNRPDQFTFSQIQTAEPCVARGSVVTDLAGVYYASPNGLVAINYYGMQNQTLSNMTREIWANVYNATKIIAARHRAQYLAINDTGEGFIIDYSEQRMGIIHVSPFADIVCVWNDVFTGDTYMIGDGRVYQWDAVDTPSLTYRWVSREFYFPAPVSLGACQVALDPSVVDAAPPRILPPADVVDPTLILPNGVNALLRLYVGTPAELVHEEWLQKEQCIFRFPSGRKAFNWQFEIVSRVPIHSVEMASTMRELKGV
jgi:hypothetical protein